MTKHGWVVLALMSLAPATVLAEGAAKEAAKEKEKAPAMPAMPPPPPEVKQTVDAFKGNWKFEATMTATGMPGMDKPMVLKAMPYNCKAVAGNTAVSCETKMKTAMGPMEMLFVISFNPYDKAVHFMGFSNMNEVHDHVCKISGLSMTCTPLKAGMGPTGDEITEDITITWEADKKCTTNDAACLATAKNMTFKSVSKMTRGGGTMTFEGKGKR